MLKRVSAPRYATSVTVIPSAISLEVGSGRSSKPR
jgi:hypothetical protein